MKCAELMRTHIRCGKLDELVEDVAAEMRDGNIGFMPVCDDQGSVVGTVTDRDLVVRVLAAHVPPSGVRLADVMTTDVVSCRPDDDLAIAEDLMSRNQKSRIVCINEKRNPVGIISVSDIAQVEEPASIVGLFQSVLARESRPSL